MEYLVLGTSESILAISKGSGDFGGGDTPLTSQQRETGNLVELPIMLIGLVPIYNVPGVHEELRFSGKVLAQIYLGEVKTWNAPQIAQLNPNVTLPDLPIKVVHRTAGKGTNYILTDFLSKTSPRFREQVGQNVSPNWPIGVATERMSDMADKVRSEPGSIGYAELQYARDNNILFGTVQNAAGKFVKASPATLTAACNAVEAPSWDKLSASLTNAQGADSYPLTSFSWVYVRKSSENSRRRLALVDLLSWILTKGQQMLPAGYSQLPTPLLVKVKNKADSMH
jgi:phosphate transport system substrate-binding protein